MEQQLLDKFHKQVWFSRDSLYWQGIMAIEEMAELQKEVTKLLRGKNNRNELIEEIADVEITIDSLKFGLNITEEEVERIKEQKINRFFERHGEQE